MGGRGRSGKWFGMSGRRFTFSQSTSFRAAFDLFRNSSESIRSCSSSETYLVGAQELVHILHGVYGVVPTTERLVGNQVELTHFRVGDLDSGVIVLRDEVGIDGEAGLGFGSADEVENLFDVGEGFASPISADLAEQAMLDGIPLGSARGIVADGND